MERRFDAIIFDLDGTLLDTLDDLAYSINAALGRFGYPTHPTGAVRRFVGSGARALAQRALAPIEDEQAAARVLAAFHEIYPQSMKNNTAPYPGMNEALAALSRGGIRMAVVSNKPHAAVVPLVRDYFGQYIKLAVGAGENTPTKPNPTGLLRALELLGCEKGRAVYMGDSDIDIATAKNAGVFALGCSWGFRERSELEQAGAGLIIDSPDELPGIFGL